MGWARGLDPFASILGVAFDGYGDDDEALAFQFFVDCLPTWQVVAAASPGCVGDEQDFLAAMLRKGARRPIEVGQCEVGRA